MEFHKSLIESKIIPKFVKLKVPDSNLKSFEIKVLSSDTFMLTICYQVHLVVAKNDSEVKNFWLFVKITPECQPEMYNLVQFHSLFTNEINAYTRIVPIFDTNKKYVKLRDWEVECSSSYLVLDDFCKGGWRLAKDMVNLSFEHICAAMHELAVFHGKFYALKIMNKGEFMDVIELLSESRYKHDLPQGYNLAEIAGCRRAIESVRKSVVGLYPTLRIR